MLEDPKRNVNLNPLRDSDNPLWYAFDHILRHSFSRAFRKTWHHDDGHAEKLLSDIVSSFKLNIEWESFWGDVTVKAKGKNSLPRILVIEAPKQWSGSKKFYFIDGEPAGKGNVESFLTEANARVLEQKRLPGCVLTPSQCSTTSENSLLGRYQSLPKNAFSGLQSVSLLLEGRKSGQCSFVVECGFVEKIVGKPLETLKRYFPR